MSFNELNSVEHYIIHQLSGVNLNSKECESGVQNTQREIAAANLPKTWTVKPLLDMTLEALWMSVFSINQLNKDSIGCRKRDTAVENNLSAAYLNCRICIISPLISCKFKLYSERRNKSTK